MPESGDKSRSFIREPVSYLKWWWREKPPTNRSTAFIGLWAISIAGVLTALAGVLTKYVAPPGNVPGYLITVVGGFCLTAGLGVAWWLTRKFYELLLRTLRAEQEKIQAELELASEKLASLEPSEETLRRFGVYSEHLYELAGALVAGEMSLGDLTSDEVKHSICEITQASLGKAKGSDYTYKVSIWREPNSSASVMDRLPDAVTDRVPPAVSDLVAGRPKFEILAAPDHTPNEREDFEVRIDPSWLKHYQRLEDDHEQELVYPAEESHMDMTPADDLVAFAKHGYKSVRAISFRRDSMIGYLVVLATHSQAFTQAEDRYLLWLKRALELGAWLGDEGHDSRGRPAAPAA